MTVIGHGERSKRVSVRSMGLADVGLAVNMIYREGWGHTRIDVERILELSPDSSYVWESGGVPRGFVTSVVYEDSAMVAHVLVSKESRGRQIGGSLFKTLLHDLDSDGVRSVILFATDEGAKLYRKFGFEETSELFSVGLYVRGNVMRSLKATCPRVIEEDIDVLVDMDERTFGDGRSGLIRRLQGEFPEHCFKVERGGEIAGFIFGRRTPIGYDIGPWICMSGIRDDAANLVSSVIGSFPAGGRVDVSTFCDHPVADQILSDYHHYKKAERVKLMIRGDPLYHTDRDKLFGVAGFELG